MGGPRFLGVLRGLSPIRFFSDPDQFGYSTVFNWFPVRIRTHLGGTAFVMAFLHDSHPRQLLWRPLALLHDATSHAEPSVRFAFNLSSILAVSIQLARNARNFLVVFFFQHSCCVSSPSRCGSSTIVPGRPHRL